MKLPKALKGGLLLALLIALSTATLQVFTNTVEDETLNASEFPIEDEQLMADLHNDLLNEEELEGFEITYNDDLSVTQDSSTIRTTNPPSQPDIVDSSIDRVTVERIPAPDGWVTEYRIRDAGRPWGLRWQTNNSFDRLTEGVTYQVQARFRAINQATHADSDESAASEITTSNNIFIRPRPNLPAHTEVRAHVREGVGGRASITATNTADVPVNLELGSVSSGNPDPILFDAVGNQIAFRNSTNLPPVLNPMNFSYTITLNPGESWNGFVGTDGDLAANNSFISISVGWTIAQSTPPCPNDRLITDPPSQPVLNYMNIRRLTVHPIPAPSGWDTEYRIRAANGSWGPWQDSNSFSGLIRGTVYQVQARFRAINQDTHADSYESEPSADMTFTPGVDPPPQPVIGSTRFPNIFVMPISAPDGWRTQYRIRNVDGSWGGWQWHSLFGRSNGITSGEVYQVQARFMEDPIVNYVFTEESELSMYITPSPDTTRAVRTGNTVTVEPIIAPNGWSVEYRISTIRLPSTWSEWQTDTSFEVAAEVTIHHVIEARFVADNTATHLSSCENLVAIALHR